MVRSEEAEPHGLFDARYLAFLETIATLRPRLHRYCARMTGSVLDGEDVVQDALFHAYRKLDSFEEGRPLAPWLFRISHNRCIDFLRRREVRQEAEAEALSDSDFDAMAPFEPLGPALGRAVEHLVLALPPKERACVLAKDVLDYSLEEAAELVGSSVGGVKAALHRGRSKLAALAPPSVAPQPASAETARLLHLYVDRFNRRDWDGVRDLIAADARLQVADRFTGRLVESPYFGRYERFAKPWHLTVGEIDGEPTIVILYRQGDAWLPHGIVRLDLSDGRVIGIGDYMHCPWIVSAARSFEFETPS